MKTIGVFREYFCEVNKTRYTKLQPSLDPDELKNVQAVKIYFWFQTFCFQYKRV